MKRQASTALIAGALLACTLPCAADSTRARCDIYPEGSDKMQTTGPCTFSQRQGCITITRDDGLTHDLSPVGDRPGNFRDQDGNPVYRQSGLAETGLIFRFPSERVFVYWDAAASLPAEVLGEPVAETDPTVVQETIITRLLEQYAREQGIRAEPAETDALQAKMHADMAASGLATEGDLTPEEKAEVDAMRLEMARDIIRQWKINKALYEQYGGRIIRQQLGPEPIDAYREFLRQREADGAFAIRDQALARSFWRYFTDDSMHDFMTAGGADEAQAFTTPPWEPRR
jgi:hypothetical protein